MNRTNVMGWAILAVFLAAGTAPAQVQPPFGTIESRGVATVDAAPDYVEFWLHRSFSGATLAEAVEGASGFGAQVDAWLKEHDLEPAEATLSEVAVPTLDESSATVSAYIRFPATSFRSEDDGLAAFATLCDQMRALAQAVGAAVDGPRFGVDAAETMEETAVARAIEMALPHAAAAARIMQARIDRVSHVEIEEVVWNQEPDTPVAQPQVRRITCTARVRVVYGFGPTAG